MQLLIYNRIDYFFGSLESKKKEFISKIFKKTTVLTVIIKNILVNHELLLIG